MAQAKHVTTAIPARITGGRAKSPASPPRTAHASLLAALAASPPHPPHPIPINTRAIYLEDRAEHLDTVLKAVSVYVTDILGDTAENVPGGLELRYIKGALADIASDVLGTNRQAADDMSGRFA